VRVRVRVSRGEGFAIGSMSHVTLTQSNRGVFHFFHFVTLQDIGAKRERRGEGDRCTISSVPREGNSCSGATGRARWIIALRWHVAGNVGQRFRLSGLAVCVRLVSALGGKRTLVALGVLYG
jgi:hypothetical protein